MRASSANATAPTMKYRITISSRRSASGLRQLLPPSACAAFFSGTAANSFSFRNGRLAPRIPRAITSQLEAVTSIGQDASVLVIAVAQAARMLLGITPRARTNTPFRASTTRMSPCTTSALVSVGSSNHIIFTTQVIEGADQREQHGSDGQPQL